MLRSFWNAHRRLAVYNLLALRLSLGPTTLAARNNSAPFVTVDGIDVDLPWSVVTGRIALQALTINRPVFSIARDAAGRLNLPAVAEPASPEPRRQRSARSTSAPSRSATWRSSTAISRSASRWTAAP